MQDVKLYTQNAPQYEGDCEYRISSTKFISKLLTCFASLPSVPLWASTFVVVSKAVAGTAVQTRVATAGVFHLCSSLDPNK